MSLSRNRMVVQGFDEQPLTALASTLTGWDAEVDLRPPGDLAADAADRLRDADALVTVAAPPVPDPEAVTVARSAGGASGGDADLDTLVGNIEAAAEMFAARPQPGRIIGVVSRDWMGWPGERERSSRMGLLLSLHRSLAMELAPHGVTVNCVSADLAEVVPDDGNAAWAPRRKPLISGGGWEDVAHAVAFFAAPESTYITGQLLAVSGGSHLLSAPPM